MDVDRSHATAHHASGLRAIRVAMTLVVNSAVASIAFAVIAPPTNAGVPASGPLVSNCREPTANGPIHWIARYRYVSQARGEAAIQVLSAGRQDFKGGMSTVAGAWNLSGVNASGSQSTIRLTLKAGSRRTLDASSVSLLTPDGNCSLYLGSQAHTGPSTGVIGDSVFANIAAQVGSKSLRLVNTTHAKWEIRATSGFGWGASAPSWPLKTVKGAWALGLARGIFVQHPSALVVELGTNDAMRLAFAGPHPRQAAAIRQGVSSDIDELLKESLNARISCIVLVTAPEHSTSIFDAGSRFAVAAKKVNQIIISDAKRAGDDVKVTDWAALSATHHEGPADWFLPDDVHPNSNGDVALVGMIQRSIHSCAGSY
jgi:lysophospholipase L1-like esterase